MNVPRGSFRLAEQPNPFFIGIPLVHDLRGIERPAQQRPGILTVPLRERADLEQSPGGTGTCHCHCGFGRTGRQ